jgi:interferon-induced GTP-binding protein Mx1
MDEVNALIGKYIAQERTIILAVVPATQDVATVGILEEAKKHDPEGVRTIGVITKPDLVPEGSEDEVLAVLQNIRYCRFKKFHIH